MIAHISRQADWERAQRAGICSAPSLEREGFIHCSEVTVQQLLAVANAHFAGQADLVLLLIDPARLAAELRYEEFESSGLFFPHLFGPLNLGAVVRVAPFAPGPDGCFELPGSA
jgi:uncharacterized protein (DUF952 family)